MASSMLRLTLVVTVMSSFAILLIVPGLGRGDQPPAPVQKTKWEYLRIAEPDDKKLAELGEAGWELVAVTGGYPKPMPRKGGGDVEPEAPNTPIQYVFKRPK